MGTKLVSKMVLNGYNSTENGNIWILRINFDLEFQMLKLADLKNSEKILPTMQCNFKTGNGL